MLKIYDGSVVSIELDFFENNRMQLLNYCWNMPYPRDSYFLIWSEGIIVGGASYTSILCRAPWRQKVFGFTENVIREAREYFSTLNDKGAEECIPVLDDEGNCLFLLLYIEEELSYEDGNAVLDLNLERDMENLDYTLLNRAEIYVFHELDDYSIEIAQLIKKKFPERKMYFLNEQAGYFFEKEDIYRTIDELYVRVDLRGKSVLHIYSASTVKKANNLLLPQISMCYSTIEVIGSLVWCKRISHWGENHSDKTILLIDFSTGHQGLVDIMRFTCCYVIMAEERGWIPYVLLNRFPNKYLASAEENMWEYFFENFSDISVEEIKHCKNIVSIFENGNIWMNLSSNPYLREIHDRLLSVEPKKVDIFGDFKNKIRLRKEIMQEIQTFLPIQFSEKDRKILGVIARGTDYRKESVDARKGDFFVKPIEQIIKYTQQIMNMWDYEYVFIMTEDGEFFEQFKNAFGERLLCVEQERVYYNSKEGREDMLLNVLKIENGIDNGVRYFASLYGMSICQGLFANSPTGAYFVAQCWNCGKYEFNQVLTD